MRGVGLKVKSGQFQSVQRPDIEQEQSERERDEHGFGEKAHDQEDGNERIPRVGSMGCVSHVCPDREPPEEDAQHILAFGDPCDGFNVYGVYSEDRCDAGAAPGRMGHQVQNSKDEQNIGDVEQEIGGVKDVCVVVFGGVVSDPPRDLRVDHQ